MSFDTPGERLRWARRQHGKYSTGSEAAKAFGWPISTYLGHENGDRNPSRTAARRYAERYGVRWEWLLTGEGAPTQNPRASVVGTVTGRGEVQFYPQASASREFVEPPPGSGLNTVAIRVGAGAMRGVADDGWLFFFDDLRRPPTRELTGKLCVIEVSDGPVLVRFLQPGRKKNRYDLESMTEPTMRDQRVVWAAAVTWIKPR